jgi:hypothetical protein
MRKGAVSESKRATIRKPHQTGKQKANLTEIRKYTRQPDEQ